MKYQGSGIRSRTTAFTLVEVTVAMSIAGMVIGGIILGYVQIINRAEWSAHSLAAHSLAQQGMEQTRAAKWDTMATPSIDQLVQSNFPPSIEVLDIPMHSSTPITATNYTRITQIRTTPPLRAVQVDCVWAYRRGAAFTNSIITYRAPDQ